VPDRASDQSPASQPASASELTPPAPPAKLIAHSKPSATPEESNPMLDVHPPHEAVHTWRDFFIHIATIVVGLCIAVGLEQTVEKLHQHHQRQQLREALQKDGEANREYIQDNIAMTQSIIDWALGQATAVEHAGPTGPLTIRRMPTENLYAPDAGVWLAAKASGTASLLSPSEQNWLEDLDNLERAIFGSNASSIVQLNAAYAALDQALVGHVTDTASGELDLSTLTAAQRTAVIGCLRSIAEQARSIMRGLVSYNIDNEFILVTPHSQLDGPQADKQYAKIARDNFVAHPALQYTFSAK
jgi:hypothetical protein